MKFGLWALMPAFALAAGIASAATFAGRAPTKDSDPSFFTVLRLPICVASLMTTTPLAGALRLGGVPADGDNGDLRADLDQELARTCGTFRT